PVVALRIRYLGGDLHRGRGERVHEVEDPGQGAEVPTERELAAETPSGTAEDGDVRATGSVDRLLLVTHQEGRNARAGELLDDLGLHGVRVLELVHQDGAQLARVARRDGGMRGEERPRLGNEIVEGEDAVHALALAERGAERRQECGQPAGRRE